MLVSDGATKAILYNVSDVSLLDTLEVKGKWETIHANRNLDTYQFAKSMRRKRITQSMYVQSYHKLGESNRYQARLYEYMKTIKDGDVKEHVLKMFYRIDENKNGFSYYLYASGIHFSFLISMIAKLSKVKRNYVALAISIFYLICFPKTFFIIRIFVFAIVSCLFPAKNKKDQLGISILLLLLYDQAILYEICFVLAISFQFVNCFTIKRGHRLILSFLIVFPIFQTYFHETNVLFLLFFPITKTVQGLLFILSIFILFIPILKQPLFFILNLQNVYLESLSLPFMKIIGKPTLLFLFAWFYCLMKKIETQDKKYNVYFLCLFFVHTQMKNLNPTMEVALLDVGQGDCILIREPFNGQVILIDVAGHKTKDIPKLNIYPYLKMQGIKHIDKVIITHDDLDHSGGLKSLRSFIPIKKVIREKQDITLDYIKLYSLSQKKYEDENDDSIVLFTQIKDKRFIFMGDASKATEKDILQEYGKLKAEVIKIGHHGSKTSSDLTFLKQLECEFALISSGYQNFYGHPHQETLDALQKNQIFTLNTQEVGSIHFYFLPFMQFIKTGSGEFDIIK